MVADYYNATWVSYSSIADFLLCPRLYYLKHLYRHSETNHKIKIITPPLTLGQAVHETIEGISRLPKDNRFEESLVVKFDNLWKEKFSGKRGGFWNKSVEQKYKKKGRVMLERVVKKPGPLKNLAVKIKDNKLPHFWLSKEEEIILCGKLDWLEYLPDSDSVHIIDFKTGQNKINNDSLQLPIYYLLASHCQEKEVSKTSYWYLALDNYPEEIELPSLHEVEKTVLEIAKKIKLARAMEKFECSQGGCRWCQPYERVAAGEGEKIGVGEYGADLYILPLEKKDNDSEIL